MHVIMCEPAVKVGDYCHLWAVLKSPVLLMFSFILLIRLINKYFWEVASNFNGFIPVTPYIQHHSSQGNR